MHKRAVMLSLSKHDYGAGCCATIIPVASHSCAFCSLLSITRNRYLNVKVVVFRVAYIYIIAGFSKTVVCQINCIRSEVSNKKTLSRLTQKALLKLKKEYK